MRRGLLGVLFVLVLAGCRGTDSAIEAETGVVGTEMETMAEAAGTEIEVVEETNDEALKRLLGVIDGWSDRGEQVIEYKVGDEYAYTVFGDCGYWKDGEDFVHCDADGTVYMAIDGNMYKGDVDDWKALRRDFGESGFAYKTCGFTWEHPWGDSEDTKFVKYAYEEVSTDDGSYNVVIRTDEHFVPADVREIYIDRETGEPRYVTHGDLRCEILTECDFRPDGVFEDASKAGRDVGAVVAEIMGRYDGCEYDYGCEIPDDGYVIKDSVSYRFNDSGELEELILDDGRMGVYNSSGELISGDEGVDAMEADE